MRTIQFETPENVQISYEAAGLGQRFIAWFVDQIFVCLITTVTLFVLVCAGITAGVATEAVNNLGDKLEAAEVDPRANEEIARYMIGGGMLVMGFGSMLYYAGGELLMRGQTPGKRWLGVRVVKANGFALDPGSVLVRNLFRAIDQLPPLWIVPVLSERNQRFGDMVAGTVVVSDRPPPLNRVRTELADRTAAEARFRFDNAALARLQPADYHSLEQLLDRWDDIPQQRLERLLSSLAPPLARRLQTEIPSDPDRLQFLEDLMAAEYRRQSRNLV